NFGVAGFEDASQDADGFLRVVDKSKQFEVFRVDHPIFDQRIEVDDLLPIVRSVKKDQYRPVEVSSLRKREHLENSIQRTDTAGECDHRAGEMREPQLAHEEIMEFETEFRRDVRIGPLFMR